MKGFIRFIERYKILHGAYWAWALIGLYHERMQFGGNSVVPALQASTIQIAGEMLSVYLTLYLIIPKTFRKTRYGLFVLLTLLSCLIGAAVATGFAILYIFIVTGDPMRHVLMWMLSNTVDCFIATAIFVAVSTVYSLYLRDRLSKKMEREKLETELSFLRAQMNPHFLFNAINNIYVLIDLDPKQAGETLLRFSGLLRYHLYECKEELVELSRELHFLNDYINMQSLRKGARIRVDVALPGDPQTMRIAPFLLLPFVENAFKFVSTGKSQQNWISIQAIIDGGTFCFTVTNSTEEPALRHEDMGGIGLRNVRRRLALLYPGRHKLNISAAAGIHEVKLHLHADDYDLPHRRR